MFGDFRSRCSLIAFLGKGRKEKLCSEEREKEREVAGSLPPSSRFMEVMEYRIPEQAQSSSAAAVEAKHRLSLRGRKIPGGLMGGEGGGRKWRREGEACFWRCSPSRRCSCTGGQEDNKKSDNLENGF